MRVLVYPHDLGMGGSQTNAIDLAAEVRTLGVEPIVFGRPGVLVERIRDLGLEYVPSPDPGRRPSLRIARILRDLAVERRLDVLHGYEWPPALECAAAAYGLSDTVGVATVMSMAVPPFIPRTMPLVVGTRQIADGERQRGRQRTHVIEPPVDLRFNVAPSDADLAGFRRRWALRPDATLVVCVTRLATELKAEGLLAAIRAVGTQLADLDIQLLIVGDGPARDQVRSAAAQVNASAGAHRVVLTGELMDPRAAYACADVVLGMGGSALRALAFGKPLIVQGENGFFELLTEDTFPTFSWQGWYGVGDDARAGSDRLATVLRPLVGAPAVLTACGSYGRRLVVERFSLSAAAAQQVRIYEEALARQPDAGRTAAGMVVAGGRFTAYYAMRKARQLRGRRATDDFNARPLAARRGQQAIAGTGPTPALVYLAGGPWHAVAGTDVHLATALARREPVIWVDPPTSVVSRWRERTSGPTVSEVAPGVTRVRPLGPPGVTRPLIRVAAGWWAHRTVQRYLARAGREVSAVLASTTEPVLHRWAGHPVRRLYFATDDFVAGADLMGMSAEHLDQARERNLRAADVVLAVTSVLAEKLQRPHLDVHVFPNGCDPSNSPGESAPALDIPLPAPLAGVIGQFNPRLDLACLEAVADMGVSLLLVGPRFDRMPAFTARLDALIARPNVHWVDRQPLTDLPKYLAALSVGLTPYADTAFNRASFPLKTLEYLAAGLPVVSTDLPAARELDRRFVRLAATAGAFAAATVATLADRPPGPPGEAGAQQRAHQVAQQRRAYAAEHSWEERAARLARLAFRPGPEPVRRAPIRVHSDRR